MNNNNNSDKQSLVEELRLIRDNLNLEMKDLTIAELKKFLNKKKTLHPNTVWQK